MRRRTSIVQALDLEARARRSGELGVLGHEALEALGLADHDLEILAVRVLGGEQTVDAAREGTDRRERVARLVGDARGHLADSRCASRRLRSASRRPASPTSALRRACSTTSAPKSASVARKRWSARSKDGSSVGCRTARS
jgi:hypothetical protein